MFPFYYWLCYWIVGNVGFRSLVFTASLFFLYITSIKSNNFMDVHV